MIARRITRDNQPETVADLLRQLGDIPLSRIRAQPPPGMATEADVIAARSSPQKRLCELIDGVLVEKAMGTRESLIAGLLLHYLWDFLQSRDLGIALGADGMLRLQPGLVLIPDVSYISFRRLPGGELPDEPIAPLSPDLAAEVLSPSNTKKEIERKLREYFRSGTRLAWVIDPKTETAEVYKSPTKKRHVAKEGMLEGEKLLPGLCIPLRSIFVVPRAKRRKPK